MAQQETQMKVAVPHGMCRCCLRAVSRRLSDVPGVVSLTYDAAEGVLLVDGEVRIDDLRRAGFEAYEVPARELDG